MNIIELASLGKKEIIAKRGRGELSAEHVWVAVSGAIEYQKAVASGDVASAEDAATRFEMCLVCKSRTQTQTKAEGIQAHWCGPALEEHKKGESPTCGCLVGVTVNGVHHAGGRTMVASAACWQRQWVEVARATIVQDDGPNNPNQEASEV